MPTKETSDPLYGRVLTAMVTPFTSDGQVDYEDAAGLATHLTENGSDGIVVGGTTGESATLTHAEKIKLFKTVVSAVRGRAAVLAGTGSSDTAATIALSREAAETGADALLVVTPYYNRPSQEGLYRHYKAVAESVTIPTVLYNVPARTGVNLEAATVARLSSIPNIVAVKEASSNLEQVAEIAARATAGFQIYSGDDGVNLPILSLGGVGAISVTSHVIGLDLQQMHRAYFGGDLQNALRLHLRSLPMKKALFSFPSPVPVKTALHMLGIIKSACVRLPHADATDDERARVRSALLEYGLLRE